MPGRKPQLPSAGAASFRRWLGCAPHLIARVRPPAGGTERHSPSPSLHRDCDAQVDRRSELTSFAAPRTQRDFHLDSALESNRTDRTDTGRMTKPTTLVSHKQCCSCWDCAA